MKRLVLVLVLFMAGLLTSEGISGKETSRSIEGVWQAVEVTTSGPVKRTITIPEPRPNLVVITAKHYSRVQVEAEGARPVIRDATKATADELRAAWGPFYAEAGTYDLTGNVITLRPVAAKNPAAMTPGAFTTWSFTMENDTLRVTTERNQDGPVANPVTVTLVRVE
jgi:hypothetical protein